MHTDPHKGLHSEQGALRGEHQGRAADPVIKVVDLAWLEFGKPDLDRAETFARDFGFTTVERTPAALRLRGVLPGTDCLVIRKSPASRFAARSSRPPTFATCGGWPTRPAARSPIWKAAAGTSAPGRLRGSKSGSSTAHRSMAASISSRRSHSTTARALTGSTQFSVHRGSPRGSSGWATWCCPPRSSCGTSTGSSNTSA